MTVCTLDTLRCVLVELLAQVLTYWCWYTQHHGLTTHIDVRVDQYPIHLQDDTLLLVAVTRQCSGSVYEVAVPTATRTVQLLGQCTSTDPLVP